jgi:hypothetical protein
MRTYFSGMRRREKLLLFAESMRRRKLEDGAENLKRRQNLHHNTIGKED